MGKSPGKWIKTVLLGKKSSKSNLSKNAKLDENTASKTPADNLIGNSPVVSDPCQFTDIGASNMELEKGTSGNSHCANVNQGVNSQRNFPLVTTDDAEMKRQDQAATKAQAAFRGYLARRAFRALKGIIRLQALIRGHLVRRQAVATLRCMHAIVKFQSLARGFRVRLSNTSPKLRQKYMIRLQDDKQMGSNSIFESEKLATNAFVRKLLLSLPTSTPLSLQYELAEPNSAWSWLERWSLSHFWVPPRRPKKATNMKPLKNQAGSQEVKTEAGKLQRSARKASNVENGALASHEIDKPKRNPRKSTSHQTELLQEQLQNEQEGVKRSSRKKSAFEKSDIKTESNSVAIGVSEEKIVIFSENTKDSSVIDKRAFLESPSNITNDPNDEKMEKIPFSQEELSSKDEEICKEIQKIRKRRSLPSKHEHVENISHKNSSLPSYMAATKSAKAKLRAQIATNFSEDGQENGYVRRHSLPASSNGKSSSLSPRIQKPMQSNGKGGSKTNKVLTSSKDDKIGWRR